MHFLLQFFNLILSHFQIIIDFFHEIYNVWSNGKDLNSSLNDLYFSESIAGTLKGTRNSENRKTKSQPLTVM